MIYLLNLKWFSQHYGPIQNSNNKYYLMVLFGYLPTYIDFDYNLQYHKIEKERNINYNSTKYLLFME